MDDPWTDGRYVPADLDCDPNLELFWAANEGNCEVREDEESPLVLHFSRELIFLLFDLHQILVRALNAGAPVNSQLKAYVFPSSGEAYLLHHQWPYSNLGEHSNGTSHFHSTQTHRETEHRIQYH